MSRHKFSANKIYTLDKTGNSTVHIPPKIICAKEPAWFLTNFKDRPNLCSGSGVEGC
jgi:hypothetical protein